MNSPVTKVRTIFSAKRVWLLLATIAGAILLAACVYARGTIANGLRMNGVNALANRNRDSADRNRAGQQESRGVGQPLRVRLIEPKPRDIERIVGQPSFVEAYERTSIYPKVTGYIEKWNVDIGDTVKRGDILGVLYVPELRELWETKKATVKLDEERVELARKVVLVAEANIKAAEARLKEAQEILNKYRAQMDRWDSEVKRLRREVEKGVVDPQVLLESDNQFKETKAAWAAAQATIMKAQADLLSMQITKDQDEVAVEVALAQVKVAESSAKETEAWVSYLQLIAPFDGIITARNANTGDFVAPHVGDPTADLRAPHLSPSGMAAPIFVVDRTDVVRVFVDVPERDAKFVQAGTPATVYIRAFRDHTIPAKVTRTAWALNVKSRTLRAEIDLLNTDDQTVPGAYQDPGQHPIASRDDRGKSAHILPGMYAYAKVMIKEQNVLAIPVSATFAVGDKTYCWSYKNGRAVRTEIRVGLADDQWVEVTNFSTNGDEWLRFTGNEQIILAEDLGVLSEGSSVQIETDGPTGGKL